MKKLFQSTKLYFSLTFALLCACVIFAVGFSSNPSASAAVIDYVQDPTITMTLDINGMATVNDLPVGLNDLNSGTNSQNALYHTRIIEFDAVVEAVRAKNPSLGSGGTFTYINGFEGDPLVSDATTAVQNRDSYGIYNPSFSSVTVRRVMSGATIAGFEVSTRERNSDNKINIDRPLKKNPNARFMFVLRHSNGNEYPVTVKVIVNSTMAHAKKTVSASGGSELSLEFQKLYVGDDYDPTPSASYPFSVIKVKNYDQPIRVDLSVALERKILYSAPESPDAINGTAATYIRSGYGLSKDLTAWKVLDAESLYIDESNTKVQNGDDLGVSLSVTNSANGTFSPSLTIQAQIPQNIVNTTINPKAKYSDIFDANVYKDLTVRVGVKDGAYIDVVFKIKFDPSVRPIQKKEFGIPRTLNAMSPEDGDHLFISTRNNQSRDSSVFRSVRVYPEDLFEFANKAGQKMAFRDGVEDVVTEGISKKQVSVTEGKDDEGKLTERTYLDIKAVSNAIVPMTFQVHYTEFPGDTVMSAYETVTVAFHIYGLYEIKEIKLGRKKLDENINSWAQIQTLTADGFYLVDYKMTSENFVADVEIKNNRIIIKPLASGSEDIDLIFRDSEGIDRREVSVSTKIAVDFTDAMGKWEPYKIILFWIFIAVVVLLFLALMGLWFYKAFAKARREELETTAPASSYIIKLNSTIAAAQAQQRMTVGGGMYQNSQGMMPLQLAAPGVQQTAAPAAFQLGVAPPVAGTQSGTYGQYGSQPGMTVSMGASELPPNAPMPPDISAGMQADDRLSEIYIPLSDDEIIEKIFKEKYEPRGMSWRSFSKSKDLQARELEKEKQRIRDEVRSGKSIEEACGLMRANDSGSNITIPKTGDKTVSEEMIVEENRPLVVLLGFDPYEKIEVDITTIQTERKETKIITDEDGEQKLIYEETTNEENELENARRQNRKLVIELEMLDGRLSRIEEEMSKLHDTALSATEKITEAEADVREYQAKITDLEVQLAMAPKKDKDRISREIVATEEKLRLARTRLAEQQKIKDESIEAETALEELSESFKRSAADKRREIEECGYKVSAAQKKAEAAAERMQRAKAQQEFDRQSAYLSPILRDIYIYDRDLRRLQEELDALTNEKANLKGEVSALQAQLMATTDPAAISRLSAAISERNSQISKIDGLVAAKTKQKSNLQIEFATLRRRANEYIGKEEISLERVIECENDVIRLQVFEDYKTQVAREKEEAEKSYESLCAEYETLANSLDIKIAQTAENVAAQVQETAELLAQTEKDLAELNAQMDALPDDSDEKLNLLPVQMELNEQRDMLAANLEAAKANGIKSNLEFKMKSEEELAAVAEKRDQSAADIERATMQMSRILSVKHISEIADSLFTPGTGVISRDQYEIEAANLKKQLEKANNQMEQARIAAQMAQIEAERLMIDAERASATNKAEMERLAQQAQEKADAARREAEVQAAAELEKAKHEAEEVKVKAAEDLAKAEEEIERAKIAAEEARALATEEAFRAKEEAVRALEEAERARLEVESEVASARRAAEAEAEEARRKAEEEMARMRLETESESKASAALSAEEEARLAAKVAKRKTEIAELRKEILNIASDKDSDALKEKFNALELRLDEEEQKSVELKMLIEQAKTDIVHRAESIRLREQANRQPQRIVKKVTERVNRIPRQPGARPPRRRSTSVTSIHNVRNVASSRSASARPGAPRPAGTRPASARPGAPRPAGTRPASARPGAPKPAGTRPASARPGAPRPAGTRPAPARPGAPRPAGTRPGAPKPGAPR